MARAIAITATHANPFHAAVDSAANLVNLAADYMYGSPKRIQVTCFIAMTLFTLSFVVSAASQPFLLGCSA